MKRFGSAGQPALASRTRAWLLWSSALVAAQLLALSTASLASPPQQAAEASSRPSIWTRRHFGAEEGVPPAITALAQTPDGFIWLGTAEGLYRFDGLSFERLPNPTSKPLQSDRVSALLAEPNGDLWVGHDWGGVSLVRGGRHVLPDQTPSSSILSMTRGSDGSSWIISGKIDQAIYWRLENDHWRAITSVPLKQFYISPPAIGRDGTLWVLRDSALWKLAPNRSVLQIVLSDLELSATLTSDPAGRIRLAANGVLKALTSIGGQPILTRDLNEISIDTSKASRFLFSDDGAVWQYNAAGTLTRHAPADNAESGGRQPLSQGLRAETATVDTLIFPPALLDHEKSIWVANNRGLDQFRRTSFVPVKKLALDQPTLSADPLILHDGRGTVWIKRGEKLYRVAKDGSLELQLVRLSSSATPCAAYDAGVWITGDSHRIRLFGAQHKASYSLIGTTMFEKAPVSSCAEDRSGRLWIQDGSALRLLDTGGMHNIDLGAENNTTIASFAADRQGRMIAYTARGNLWRFDGSRRQVLWNKKNIPFGFVEFIYQGPSYLLLGGDRGLARFDGQRFQLLRSDRFPALSLVGGAFQTRAGDTWLTTIRGVLKVRTRELDRAFSDPNYAPQFQLFSEADGLPGTPSFFNRSNMAADDAGRLWVGTSAGVAVLDPAMALIGAGPPNVVLTSVLADGESYMPTPGPIVLQHQPGRLEVAFTAPTFVDPVNTVIRYRLVGVDRDWVTALRERRAAYMNLAPGQYRFEVIAAGPDGSWNTHGPTVTIIIPARFYQTWWFTAVCAATLVILVAMIFRWRLTAITRRLRIQAAERADERGRIARELHDTLLQSVQGLVLMFQSVARKMGPSDPNHDALERTLQQADEVIAEGRARVLDLRSADQAADVADVVKGAARRVALPEGMYLEIDSSTPPLVLRPEGAHEIEQVVSEAVANAARHSRGTHVVIDVRVSRTRLSISVTDDGRGMHLASQASSEHHGFGILGMQERARRIGAKLRIESPSSGGTRIRLVASIRRIRSRRRWPLLWTRRDGRAPV
jgi:signal transduction histidine kinase/ligand-binding sensor domain-containing protein